jgi:hypothetical protein
MAAAVCAELKACGRVVAYHSDLCHHRGAARDRQHAAGRVAAVRPVHVAVGSDIGEIDVFAGVAAFAEPRHLARIGAGNVEFEAAGPAELESDVLAAGVLNIDRAVAD